MKKLLLSLLFSIPLIFFVACGDDDDSSVVSSDDNDEMNDGTNNDDIGNNTSALPAAFDEFDAENVSITLEGDEVIIESNGYPNHTSPYWSESDALYVESEDANFNENKAPGVITNYTGTTSLTVPVSPSLASSTSTTGLGAIGIAVSGSVIYNDQEGPNVPLEFPTAYSLDYTGAHTGPMSYHYHVEPIAWSEDDDELIGIMSDGFFLYGRKCTSTGTYPTDLDASGGHVSTTKHNTNETYHYHIQNELYVNTFYLLFPGNYQGTPNAISQ